MCKMAKQHFSYDVQLARLFLICTTTKQISLHTLMYLYFPVNGDWRLMVYNRSSQLSNESIPCISFKIFYTLTCREAAISLICA